MSTKQSDTSRPPEIVVVLDENLSSPLIAGELAGFPSDWVIELHRTHFPEPKTPDTEVLRICGEKGWILISCDDKMRLLPENKRQARKSGARVFLLPKGNYKGVEYRSALIAGRHRLLNFVKKMPPPHFARITMQGAVHFFEQDRPLSTAEMSSRQKTEQKYGKRVFDENEADEGEDLKPTASDKI